MTHITYHKGSEGTGFDKLAKDMAFKIVYVKCGDCRVQTSRTNVLRSLRSANIITVQVLLSGNSFCIDNTVQLTEKLKFEAR